MVSKSTVSIHYFSGRRSKNSKKSDDAFGNKQLFLAHAAPSDLSNKKYIHHERVAREGWQARAGQNSLDFKVAGIQATMTKDGDGHRVTTLYPVEESWN